MPKKGEILPSKRQVRNPQKRGVLSLEEKYAIQGLLHDKKNITEISEILRRSEQTIKKYVDAELNDLIETIAKVKIQQTDTKSKIKQKDKQKDQVGKQFTAQDLMVRKTANKEGGVAVMTQAASAKGDDFLRKMPKQRTTRSTRGNIYDIKTKKILDGSEE